METLKNFFRLLHFGSYFHSSFNSAIGFEYIFLTKTIADLWECDAIAKKESDWAGYMSVQTSDGFKMNLQVLQFIWRRKQRQNITFLLNFQTSITIFDLQYSPQFCINIVVLCRKVLFTTSGVHSLLLYLQKVLNNHTKLFC